MLVLLVFHKLIHLPSLHWCAFFNRRYMGMTYKEMNLKATLPSLWSLSSICFVLKSVLCLEMETFLCYTFGNSKHYGDIIYVLDAKPDHECPEMTWFLLLCLTFFSAVGIFSGITSVLHFCIFFLMFISSLWKLLMWYVILVLANWTKILENLKQFF